ncbi:MAG: beta-lactamase family protein [Gemmatimonadales bacterium]|nr:beta-lactamase family protein [Gemmatimonadales bacterium]
MVMRFMVLAWCLVLASPLPAQFTDRARVATLDRILQDAVDSNRIGGAVALVMRDGKVVYQRAVGWNDREAGRQMMPDALFRIASQTKALTSVAVMMLVEEGRVALSDRVSRFIPAYASTSVATRADTGVAIAPARRAITVRDLLTHTAGISYGTEAIVAQLYKAKGLGPAAGRGWYTADKDEPVCTTMERLASLPFVAQPGEEFVYGYNTDILGCVVERASGMPLDEFIRTRITVPLGMRDTWFFVPESGRTRLTAVYASDSAGHASRADDGARGQGHYVDGPRRSFSGGAGLVSTAQDYARFLSMLLNRGEIDGVRLLGARTVDVMSVNQVGTLYSSDGRGFGLGFETVDRFGASGFASLGTYGWGGAYGSNYKVDPAERLVIVYMTQMAPDASGTRERFVNAVYATLVD